MSRKEAFSGAESNHTSARRAVGKRSPERLLINLTLAQSKIRLALGGGVLNADTA